MAKLNPMRFVGVPLPIVAPVVKQPYVKTYPEGRVRFGMYATTNADEVEAMDRMSIRMADALVSARRGALDVAKRKVEVLTASDRIKTKMFELVYVAFRKYETDKLEQQREKRTAKAEWRSTRPARMLKMARHKMLESTPKEKYDTTLYHRQNGTVRARGVWDKRRLDFGTYPTEARAHQVALALSGFWIKATEGREYSGDEFESLNLSEPIAEGLISEMKAAARLAAIRRPDPSQQTA